MKRLREARDRVWHSQWLKVMVGGWLLGGFAAVLAAVPAAGIPAPLQPWVDWVLHDVPDANCTPEHAPDARRLCVWPGRLLLEVKGDELVFMQGVRLEAPSWVTLPGQVGVWPQQVRVNGAAGLVVEREGRPSVHLPAGQHRLTGRLSWQHTPEYVQLPTVLGLVAQVVEGTPQPMLDVDAQGRWWLSRGQREADVGVADSLRVEVMRLLRDGVPVQVDTQVRLIVTGQDREVRLGPALPPLFALLALDSPLPARIEPDGSLRVQVRAGTWTLNWRARALETEPQLHLPAASGGWPAQEWWSVQQDLRLRQLSFADYPRVDPGQAPVPNAWKENSVWRLPLGEPWALQAEPVPVSPRRGTRLQLERQLWLDFAGRGATVQDRLSGTVGQDWRLDSLPPLKLGAMSVSGKPQLVTREQDSERLGVEVRQSTLDAQALSRLEGGPGFARWNLPVHGWAVAFDAVSWQLQLPPGWRLLSATAEQVRGSWLERWTIWDVFLVLLTVAAAGRVLGRRWAFVALPMAVLLYPESPGLISALLVVLAMLALVRLPLRGMGARLVRGIHLLAQLALVVGTLSLVVEQVRLAIYPQLERYASLPGEGHEYADSAMASAPVMAQDMATLSRMREEYAPKRAAAPASPAPEPLPDWDPDARIQTGPGVPAWRWNSAYLSWQGPVESEDSVTVYLLSPGWVSFARVLMALLIGALVLQCVRSAMTLRPPEEPGGHPRALALWPGLALMLALGGGLGAPTPLQAAELPDPAWLDRLQTRLLEAPPCTPTCVAEQDTWLVVDGDALTLTLSVNALAQGVLRIPAHREAWLPSDILLDGQGGWPARMGEDGFLRVAIPPGQHELVLEGRLQGADAWEIRWPERPHAFRIDVRGWRTQGVRDAVLQGNSLRIERDARIDKPAADAQATLFPDPIAPFVQVERTLVLGQRWELISRVVRKAPARGAIAVSLPLWPGEQVLSRDLNVRDGRIDVVLGAEQEQVLWRSALDPVDRIELAAETGVPWHEIWRVRPGMPWHLRSQLLEPVEWVNAAGQWQPEWWPRAGERLLLQVQRPQAVVGPTLTVDRLKLNHSPGAQRARIDLTLDLRTSLGERLHWPLPTGWTLREVQIDGVPQGRTRQADVMDLALTPGTHRVTASIDSDSPMRGYWHLEAPMVPWPVANLEQQVEVPGDRWLLLARGPGVGPAVLYWGVLPVIVVLAWGLGRHTGNPLGMGAWLLLGIGLSLSEAWHALLVAGWFYAMAWRGRQVVDPVGWRFNLRQMGLVLFSVVTLLVLIGNVPTGLLGQPDMWVSGNGSGAGHLRWYTDRVAEGSLPLPAIFSLPLWVYRLLMLGWSLWLAFALLGWLRWGWQCLTQGGGFGPWRSGKASVAPAAEASTPAVSAAEPDSSADPRV